MRSSFCRLLLFALICFTTSTHVLGQTPFLRSDQYEQKRTTSVQREPSAYERQVLEKLEKPLIATTGPAPIKQAIDRLSISMSIPFRLPPDQVLSRLAPENAKFQLSIANIPLGVALKHELRKWHLEYVVEDDAVIIFPNVAYMLQQDYLPSYQFTKLNNAWLLSIEQKLAQPISLELEPLPLIEFCKIFETQTGVQLSINVRAMEDIGLEADLPVKVSLRDIPAMEILTTVLAELELDIVPRNGYLEITTYEAAEDHKELLVAVFWLEGTGLEDDYDHAIEMIQNTIEPDTWEWVGGPSTINHTGYPHRDANGVYRRALVVSSTYQVCRQIDALLRTIRTGQSLSCEATARDSLGH